MGDIKFLARYRATIRQREDDRYRLRSDAQRDLNGRRGLFQSMGEVDGRPMYEGEHVMRSLDGLLDAHELPWLASGDLVDLEEVPYARE